MVLKIRFTLFLSLCRGGAGKWHDFLDHAPKGGWGAIFGGSLGASTDCFVDLLPGLGKCKGFCVSQASCAKNVYFKPSGGLQSSLQKLQGSPATQTPEQAGTHTHTQLQAKNFSTQFPCS